jgi:hypothetical protein
MTTYKLNYSYNSQPSVPATQEDLLTEYPYELMYNLLNALTVNQRKNLKNITITSGKSDKHSNGYNKEFNLGVTNAFYKVKLVADKNKVNKKDTIKLTVTTTNITTVSKVEFYLGGTRLTELTVAPYVYSYVTDKVGSYLVTAKVTDSDNTVTVSNPVTLTIQ